MNEMLTKVDALYNGRATGDLTSLKSVLAENATFVFAGERSLVAAFPSFLTNRPDQVAEALYEQIDMLDRKSVEAFANDNKLAVLWDTQLRVKGGEPFRQQLFDIWEFDGDGHICRGTQFQDTAKIIEELTSNGAKDAS